LVIGRRFDRVDLGDHPVAGAVHALDVTRLGMVVAKDVTESANGVGNLFFAIVYKQLGPKRGLDLLPGDQASFIANQEVKQVEHLPVDPNRNPISDEAPVFRVINERCKGKDGRLALFHTGFGGKANLIMTLVPFTGDSAVASSDDEGESDLDIEYSGSIAKDATVNQRLRGNGAACGFRQRTGKCVLPHRQ
jgi:hypothetical protein